MDNIHNNKEISGYHCLNYVEFLSRLKERIALSVISGWLASKASLMTRTPEYYLENCL